MRNTIALLLALCLLFAMSSCTKTESATVETSTAKALEVDSTPAFHLAIVTGTGSQSENDRRGAIAFQNKYGNDTVKLATYPDDFTEEYEKTIQTIVAFADDPLMKAIIVNQAVPGTAEAFAEVKEKRSDILCLAGEPHEELPVIASTADLVVNNDYVSRGYLIIKTAHELGCDTFVHISFPRHLKFDTISRRLTIMKKACEEFGMTFAEEIVLDPTTDGLEESKEYILEKVPQWVEQYGTNAAFFCTNDSQTGPLIKQLLAYGGYFIEADLPSPLMGYPAALGLELSEIQGDFVEILKKVETAVVEAGGAGRFGTWVYSYGYSVSTGLAQHAYNVLTGQSELLNLEDLASAFSIYSGDAKWKGTNYTNAFTGEVSNNMFLIYQDTYILGKEGDKFMHTTEAKVPDWTYTIIE